MDAGHLADSLRMRDAPGGVGGAYGACRLWDSLAKHNAMVWGRTRGAVEEADNDHKATSASAVGEAHIFRHLIRS